MKMVCKDCGSKLEKEEQKMIRNEWGRRIAILFFLAGFFVAVATACFVAAIVLSVSEFTLPIFLIGVCAVMALIAGCSLLFETKPEDITS